MRVYRSGVKMTAMRSKGGINENPNKTTALICDLDCSFKLLQFIQMAPLFAEERIEYELERSYGGNNTTYMSSDEKRRIFSTRNN